MTTSFKDPRGNRHGGVDVTLIDDKYGEIPYTVPADGGVVDMALLDVAEIAPYVAPPPPPIEQQREGWALDRAAFIAALVGLGVITQAESEQPGVPASIAALIDQLPEAERGPARTLYVHMQVVPRTAPLLAAVAAHTALTDADIDTAYQTWMGA